MTSHSSETDNTFTLTFGGGNMMRLLYEMVRGDKMKVAVADGLMRVTLELDDAAVVFGRKINEFSFLEHGDGFVQIDGPITFKWQMFDEKDDNGERKTFVHAEGRASVSIASYAVTDRMGQVIKTTRSHPDSKKQLFQVPRKIACYRRPW